MDNRKKSAGKALVGAPCFSRGELDFKSSGEAFVLKIGFSRGIRIATRAKAQEMKLRLFRSAEALLPPA